MGGPGLFRTPRSAERLKETTHGNYGCRCGWRRSGAERGRQRPPNRTSPHRSDETTVGVQTNVAIRAGWERSPSLRRMSRVTSRFSGLMSRWMIPWKCRYSTWQPRAVAPWRTRAAAASHLRRVWGAARCAPGIGPAPARFCTRTALDPACPTSVPQQPALTHREHEVAEESPRQAELFAELDLPAPGGWKKSAAEVSAASGRR